MFCVLMTICCGATTRGRRPCPGWGGETPRDDCLDDLLVSYRTLAANRPGFATEASSYGTLLGHTHCQFAAAAQAPATRAATCATSTAALQK